jgi:hypothetical protein
MYAAPFDNDINIVNKDDTIIGRKRANNKTQKRMPLSSPKENNYSEKVNSVLQTIHNLPHEEDETLADFNPPPPPQSSGVEQTKMRENEQSNSGIMGMFAGKPSQTSKPQFLNDYESGNQHYSGELGNGTASQDYQRFMPNYSEMYNKNTANSMPYSGSSIMTGGYSPSMMYGSGSGDKNDLLIEKMNYVIKLLEDQQDEKTGNVTEEVILYSFLGIFIIFIVDSFARVGKYTR